jgi:PAS domain S-box-containing protein
MANTEDALLALTSGQIDSIADTDGRIHLLRPAQEYLRQRERRLQDIINSAPDMVTVLDRTGVIVFQNQAAGPALGYDSDELAGTNFFALVHAEDLGRAHAWFFSVMDGPKEKASAIFRQRTSDGSYAAVEAIVARLNDAEAQCAVVGLRPLAISPSVAAPEVAKDGAPRDQVLAILSHEMRTPLTSILLGIELMREDPRFEGAREILEMVRRNVELQTRLVEDLGDFSRLGQNKVRLRPRRLDFHEAIRFVLANSRAEAAAAGVLMLTDLAAPNSVVLADPERLQQVIGNLIKNAVKFSSSGGTLSIRSSNDAEGAFIADFIDRGIGISPDLLPLVFDAFRQGQAPGRHDGIGLGLFIAKGLTEAQDGTLTARSAGSGQGATFRLRFPTVEAERMKDEG